MLMVAKSLPKERKVTILTYNRTLCDDCNQRIRKLRLVSRVSCYTIHGFLTKVTGKLCNDDRKLSIALDGLERNGGKLRRPPTLDLLMIDEAQDLRPSFVRAIRMVLRSRTNSGSLQMCLVGDPKQLLYDFPTYGDDKASAEFMEKPDLHWGEFTASRKWVERRLSVSYRLTPNMAAFVNVPWVTSIVGGNLISPDRPVQYICAYPFPAKGEFDTKGLHTSFLANLIDEYGPENVMFLANSVKHEKCPIRVHVNDLMTIRENGHQKYNFHVKESLRGFEGEMNLKNKVRVWTFCGSKGCEADCVVVFGFDLMDFGGRVTSLNQMGVALSRARKHLVVIHSKGFSQFEFIPNYYFPVSGDQGVETLLHTVDCRGKNYAMEVPPYVGQQFEKERALAARSSLTEKAFRHLLEQNIIEMAEDELPRIASESVTGEALIDLDLKRFYKASQFNYFGATALESFLEYGTWIAETPVVHRLSYNVNVEFQRTTEDVSALYGEALTFMLQWERDGYCPNVETLIGGTLIFNQNVTYEKEYLLVRIAERNCEPLSSSDIESINQEFTGRKTVKGKDLIAFINNRLRIQKRRLLEDSRMIYFPVRARRFQKDNIMNEYMDDFKDVYNTAKKSAADWMYLANASMAYDDYHEKFKQIGTTAKEYKRWVQSDVLKKGLGRLQNIMKDAFSFKLGDPADAADSFDPTKSMFERWVGFDFPFEEHIKEAKTSTAIVGVDGYCDWAGEGLVSPGGEAVDLLEIKFVNELCDVHRLQTLVYCALLALERGARCAAMLFNARTGECEVVKIDADKALEFILDLARFKNDGTRRKSSTTAENAVVVEVQTGKLACTETDV